MQSLKQKTDFSIFFSPITFPLSPTISVLRLNHHKKTQELGKNTFLILPRAAGTGVIFYTQCKQERCLHNCMEKWKEPASLGSCVWQKMRLLQLFWKIWGVESSRKRAREKNREGKKAALKRENNLLEEKE